jgi:hypothetical protein
MIGDKKRACFENRIFQNTLFLYSMIIISLKGLITSVFLIYSPGLEGNLSILLSLRIYVWRRRRDLNPRAAYTTYTLSRGASSAA